MIVSHTYKFAIVTPPKTASTTLHEWLIAPPFCDRHYPPPDQRKGQHDTPEPLPGDYTVAFSWRNPLDREVSLWAHSQAETSRKKDGTPRALVRRIRGRLPACSAAVLLGITGLVVRPLVSHRSRDSLRSTSGRRAGIPTDPIGDRRRALPAADAAAERLAAQAVAGVLHSGSGADRARAV